MTRTTEPITSQDAIDKLLSIEGREGMYIHFGLFTALRVSEILQLKWEQVIAPDGKVKSETFIRRLKKRKECWARIGLSKQLRDRIQTYYEERGCPILSLSIFPGRGNEFLTKETINNNLRLIFKDLKIKTRHPSSHTLRKTFGRRFYESRVKAGDVRALPKTMLMLGKTSERDTLRYIGVEEDVLVEDFQNFSYVEY